MSAPTFESVSVGDEPIHLQTEPVSRTTLALYAGASGDHNPMHIDIDFAKKAGQDDVFAHGMLLMAYMGRSLTDWVPQTAIRSFLTKFTAITRVGETITCTGKIIDKREEDGEKLVKIELSAVNQNKEGKGAGEAVVALP